ncbi:translation initiation factor IF-3 [Roseibium sediminis]|uniref:translation initiation factor IF-3 n=1 Tax=Roseibium sediminis TaxID=1775174 RepID=UPI00123D5F68|nr:translation initiation factor IF-3 [Roseibium sediminis]
MTNNSPVGAPAFSFSGLRLFFQLLRVAAGFVCAVLTFGFFLAWGYFGKIGPDTDPVEIAALVSTGAFAASAIGGMAFFPALVAIGVAEVLRLKGMLMHVGVAGMLAFAIWTVGHSMTADVGLRPGTTVVLAGGFMAGFIYWMIAGRLSGCWIVNPPTQERPES